MIRFSDRNRCPAMTRAEAARIDAASRQASRIFIRCAQECRAAVVEGQMTQEQLGRRMMDAVMAGNLLVHRAKTQREAIS